MIKISLGDRFQNSCKVMILGNQILGLLGEPGHLYASQPIPCQPAEYSLKKLDSITVVFKCGLINSNWMLSTSPIFACHRTICQKQDKGKLE